MLLHEFKSGTCTINVFDSIKDHDLSSKWAGFSGLENHLRSELLIAIENSKPEELKFRYLFIYEDEGRQNLLGIIYFQVLKFNRKSINISANSFSQVLAKIALGIKTFRVLMAGSVFSVDFSPLSYKNSALGISDLLKIIDDYSTREKHDLLVMKDLPDDFNGELLSPYNFSPFETDLTMQLEINPAWKELGDYENALTHKYAQRFRKIRKQGAMLDRKSLSFDEFSKHRKTINQLFKQVSSRQTIRMCVIDDMYFEELFKALKGDFIIIGYFLNDKMVAFASYILYGQKLEVHFIGIDYKHNQEHALYFNILFDSIEMAIRFPKPSLELGRTAREAKAVAGCHPIYFNDYYRVRSPIIRWVLKVVLKYFDTGLGEGWKKRHPFKTTSTHVLPK